MDEVPSVAVPRQTRGVYEPGQSDSRAPGFDYVACSRVGVLATTPGQPSHVQPMRGAAQGHGAGTPLLSNLPAVLSPRHVLAGSRKRSPRAIRGRIGVGFSSSRSPSTEDRGGRMKGAPCKPEGVDMLDRRELPSAERSRYSTSEEGPETPRLPIAKSLLHGLETERSPIDQRREDRRSPHVA